MVTSSLISIGQIEKPHGFRGSFVVRTDSGKGSALGYLKNIYLQSDSAKPLEITEAAWMPKGWKVTVSSVTSEEEVRKLVGKSLFARREDLPDPEAGEYYLADLENCEAVDSETGAVLGKFKTLEDGSPYDHWWFLHEGIEFSIPGLSRFIKAVDTQNKKITIQNFSLPVEE